MFGVGLHFSLKDLARGPLDRRSRSARAKHRRDRWPARVSPWRVGWTWQTGLILGIAVSVASTVVLLRALMDHGGVDTPEGHAAVGWLVVEDIITVLVLVLLPPLRRQRRRWREPLADDRVSRC